MSPTPAAPVPSSFFLPSLRVSAPASTSASISASPFDYDGLFAMPPDRFQAVSIPLSDTFSPTASMTFSPLPPASSTTPHSALTLGHPLPPSHDTPIFMNRSSPVSYAVQSADAEVASACDRGIDHRSAILESNSATPLSTAVGSPIDLRSPSLLLSSKSSNSDRLFHDAMAPQSDDVHVTLDAASRADDTSSQHDCNVPTEANLPWLESPVPPQSAPALPVVLCEDSDCEELPDGSPQSLAALLEQQRIAMSNAVPARTLGVSAWPEARKPNPAVCIPSAEDQALLRGLMVPAASADGHASSEKRSGPSGRARVAALSRNPGGGAAERGLGLEAWLNGHLGQNAHVRDLHALQAAAKRAAAISVTQTASDVDQPHSADGNRAGSEDCGESASGATADSGVLHDRRNLQALSIDRQFLLANGVSSSLVDRIYRALYVYSAGLFEVFGEISLQVSKSSRHLVCGLMYYGRSSALCQTGILNSSVSFCIFASFFSSSARSTLACGRPSPS